MVVYWREGINPVSANRALEVLNKELGVKHLEWLIPKIICYGSLRPVISLYTNYDVGKKPYATKEIALELAEKIREALHSPRAPEPVWCFDDRPTYNSLR